MRRSGSEPPSDGSHYVPGNQLLGSFLSEHIHVFVFFCAGLRIQGRELVREFPNMLMKLVIVLSEPLGASRPFIQVKGFIGTGSQKNRNVCRCDVYELRDQENDIVCIQFFMCLAEV